MEKVDDRVFHAWVGGLKGGGVQGGDGLDAEDLVDKCKRCVEYKLSNGSLNEAMLPLYTPKQLDKLATSLGMDRAAVTSAFASARVRGRCILEAEPEVVEEAITRGLVAPGYRDDEPALELEADEVPEQVSAVVTAYEEPSLPIVVPVDQVDQIDELPWGSEPTASSSSAAESGRMELTREPSHRGTSLLSKEDSSSRLPRSEQMSRSRAGSRKHGANPSRNTSRKAGMLLSPKEDGAEEEDAGYDSDHFEADDPEYDDDFSEEYDDDDE